MYALRVEVKGRVGRTDARHHFIACRTKLLRSDSPSDQALDQLEEAGVLKPASTSKRNRVWEAVGLLTLLEGLEAGRVPA